MSDLHEARLLRDNLKKRVEQSPDYKAWQAMEQVILHLEAEYCGGEATSGKLPITGYSVKMPKPSYNKSTRKRSYADAACQEISMRNKPMTTNEIVELVIEEGLASADVKPVNIASSLSRDERLESVSFESQRQWWFAGKPLPTSAQSFFDETGGQE